MPWKREYVKANHVPYMTKATIMHRSQLESKYWKTKIVWNFLKTKKKFAVSCTQRKKKYYKALDIKNMTDKNVLENETIPFWQK